MRADVYPPVVEHVRRIVLARLVRERVQELLAQRLVGNARQVRAENDVLEIVACVLAIWTGYRRLERARFDLLEPRGLQATGGDLGRGELPRPAPALEIGPQRLAVHQRLRPPAHLQDVGLAAALGDEPAARL